MIKNHPFITDQKNIDWLNANETAFIDFLAKNHSIQDIAHTILHPETLDDAYVSKIIASYKATDKKRMKENAAREAAIAAEPPEKPKKDKIKQKNDIVSSAVEEQQKARDADSELFD